jgi:hypothetical protein
MIGPFYFKTELDPIAIGAMLVAIAAIFVAWRQLRAAGNQIAAAIIQTRAGTMLALDQRWETEPLISARKELLEFANAIREEARTTLDYLSTEEQQKKCLEQFAERLHQLRWSDYEKYNKFFLICGYFETVGYCVQVGYLPVDNVIGLLGISIADTGSVFELHIRKLQSEAGGDARLYRNFLWLVSEARKAGL